MRTGRCLCGLCSYEIDGEPLVVAICHCLDCQRFSGAGHMTGAMFAEDGIHLKGEPATYSMTSEAGNTVTRLFCADAAALCSARNTGMPGFITVMMGTLDSSEGLKPQVAIFVRSCRHSDATDLAVQTFDAQPNWTPPNTG